MLMTNESCGWKGIKCKTNYRDGSSLVELVMYSLLRVIAGQFGCVIAQQNNFWWLPNEQVNTPSFSDTYGTNLLILRDGKQSWPAGPEPRTLIRVSTTSKAASNCAATLLWKGRCWETLTRYWIHPLPEKSGNSQDCDFSLELVPFT